MARVKLTDKVLKDNPLGEIILILHNSAKNLSSMSKNLEDCFVTSIETFEPIVDPFLAKTVVSTLESDPAITQHISAEALSQLKMYILTECEKVADSFEARLRPFCERNNIPLEGRFPTYILAGFYEVSVEQAKGICRIGGKTTKSLMLESIAPTILEILKNEAERPFEIDLFLKELYEAYERVTRLRGLDMGQPAQILDVFRELVFVKQSPTFGRNPVRSNFKDYTRVSFARDLARASAISTNISGKRLELMPTAFPREDGLLIRIGESTRYAGRLAFSELIT